jgi:dTDP-4-dehydrorhamnose reductase
MRNHPILVVGRSGQLARCLHDWSGQHQASLVFIGRPHLDLERPAEIRRIVTAIEPAAIINAAAYTTVDLAETEPDRAFAVNRDGPAHLAAAARARGIPFVHMSTDYVFDGRKDTPYREDDPTGPLNIYGRSKLEGEAAVVHACPHAIVVRTSWVYSPYGQNFVRTMVRLAETRPLVRVVDDQRGTPTSAIDLAAAVMEIIRQSVSGDAASRAGVYHLTGQGETTWHGFAAEIFAGLARRGRTVPRLQPVGSADYPTAAHRPRNSCLDSSKAERVFSIRLGPWPLSLRACLDQLVGVEVLQAC